MGSSWARRLSAIALVVLILSVMIVPSASAGGSVVHYVRYGETLASIARLYGVNMYAIAQANNLANIDRIWAGQRLVIPTSGGGGILRPPAWGCPVLYAVQRGENLTQIAYRYRVSVAQLLRWNALANANRIYPGMVLKIYNRCAPGKPVPPPPPAQTTWTATYYNNRDLSGAPVLQRSETSLSHNWGFGSPATQVFADNFSARWTRTFNMAAGTYRISVKTDDGARVFIDGVLVIDSWKIQAATVYATDVVIPAGDHTFTVEYFEAEGVAEISILSTKL